jgi:actin-like protein 6A
VCRLCELMFEKFQSGAFFLAKDSVLACYACGKTSGLVVDCGASGTVISPISDGWVETKGLARSSIGGRVMDAYLLSLLTKRSKSKPRPLYKLTKQILSERNNELLVTENTSLTNVHPSYDAYMHMELMRDIKESTSKLCDQSLLESEARYANMPNTPYELPDGTMIDLGLERFQVPELFFDTTLYTFQQDAEYLNYFSGAQTPNTSAVPINTENIAKLATNSILHCESEVQSTLYSNVVFTGGNSSFEGFPERMKLEMEKLIYLQAPGARLKTVACGKSERVVCSWLGGSIVASLGSFHEVWVTKKEYEEYGSMIVDKKCP